MNQVCAHTADVGIPATEPLEGDVGGSAGVLLRAIRHRKSISRENILPGQARVVEGGDCTSRMRCGSVHTAHAALTYSSAKAAAPWNPALRNANYASLYLLRN